MNKLFFAVGLFAISSLLNPLDAQVIISEIMYDAQGTDAGFEWIEIYNTGQESIEVADWRFRENDVNHYLSLELGATSVLSPSAYAIIASDSAKFLSSNPDFSSILFDSVFSLNNQGESLELVAGDQIIDSVYYTPQDGANGTGASLQYFGGSWIASIATPGQPNQNNTVITDTSKTINSITSPTLSEAKNTARPKKQPFKPYYIGTLDMEPVMLAGTPLDFDFEMLYYREEGKQPTTKRGGTFVWNMGDGKEFIQDWEEEFQYVYEYPGLYSIHISYTRSSLQKKPDYIFSTTITIDEASILIGQIDANGSIRIDNNTNKIVDMSGWSIIYGEQQYIFPEHTTLPPGEKRFIVKDIHGFSHIFPESYLSIQLIRPTGNIHQNQVTKEIIQEDIFTEPTAHFTEEISIDIIPQTNEIITIQESKEGSHSQNTMLWGVGIASALSLLGSLFIALRSRHHRPEEILRVE